MKEWLGAARIRTDRAMQLRKGTNRPQTGGIVDSKEPIYSFAYYMENTQVEAIEKSDSDHLWSSCPLLIVPAKIRITRSFPAITIP